MVGASIQRSATTAAERISDYIDEQPIVGLGVVGASIAGGVFGGMVALDEVVGENATRAKRGAAGIGIAAVAMLVAAAVGSPFLGMVAAAAALGVSVAGFLPRNQVLGEAPEAQMIRQRVPKTGRRAIPSPGQYR